MTPTRRPEPGRAAGFWQRELAWLIDALLLSAGVHVLLGLWLLLPLPFPDLLGGATPLQWLQRVLALAADPLVTPQALLAVAGTLLRALLVMAAIGTGLYALLALPYFVLQEAGPWRATLGKRALGLAVEDRHGAALDTGRATLRHLAAALSWATLNLGHALAAWTPSRRALHDHLSGTRVVAREPRLPGWARALVAVQLVLLLVPPLLLAAALATLLLA